MVTDNCLVPNIIPCASVFAGVPAYIQALALICVQLDLWQLIHILPAPGNLGQCCYILYSEPFAELLEAQWHVHDHVSCLLSTGLLVLSSGVHSLLFQEFI